jgi:protocatechuate 3,4-dioxygenase beta subunit
MRHFRNGAYVLAAVGLFTIIGLTLQRNSQKLASVTQVATVTSVSPPATTSQNVANVLTTLQATPLSLTTATNGAAATIPKTCSGTLTKAETEGPYYSKGSPAKTNFALDDPTGEIITMSGYVFDASCAPIPNAYLDLWHANSAGAYDNSGYTLRGHFQADANGFYTVRTVVAGKYPGRTEHWHIKVARDSSLNGALTTQLFPPGGQSQEGDGIYDASLLVNNFTQNAAKTERTADFNFVIK